MSLWKRAVTFEDQELQLKIFIDASIVCKHNHEETLLIMKASKSKESKFYKRTK